MAGWDEEALLLATLIVEDTPDRDIKNKKRSVLNSKSPSTNSTRKRRAQRISQPIPIAVLDLDEEETPKKDSGIKKKEKKNCVSEEESKVGENESTKQNSTTSSTLPCIDKLREELSCAICLEICYEPSTTPCGHSFCKKCLRSAADKCGKKCPKCRQLISDLEGNPKKSNETHRIYSEALLELCHRMNIKAVDMWSSIQKREDWKDVCFLDDGTHFSAEGSKIVADEILKVLREAKWEPSLHWMSMPVDFGEDSPYDPVLPDGTSTINISNIPFPYDVEWRKLL